MPKLANKVARKEKLGLIKRILTGNFSIDEFRPAKMFFVTQKEETFTYSRHSSCSTDQIIQLPDNGRSGERDLIMNAEEFEAWKVANVTARDHLILWQETLDREPLQEPYYQPPEPYHKPIKEFSDTVAETIPEKDIIMIEEKPKPQPVRGGLISKYGDEEGGGTWRFSDEFIEASKQNGILST